MRRLALIGLVVALAGCVTPSIPIPPPDPARMNFDVTIVGTTSNAVFTYPPEQNYVDSIVYVFNRDRGTGIITTARPDGGVGPTQPFPAVIGNQVVITFEMPEDTVSSCVRVTDGTPNALDVCY